VVQLREGVAVVAVAADVAERLLCLTALQTRVVVVAALHRRANLTSLAALQHPERAVGRAAEARQTNRLWMFARRDLGVVARSLVAALDAANGSVSK